MTATLPAGDVHVLDVLPNLSRTGDDALEYMLDRTMGRPRDAIAFFNACITKAVEQPRITKQMLLAAEGEYSQDRLRALANEWESDYPTLYDFVWIFKKHPSQFPLRALATDTLEDFCLDFLTAHEGKNAPLVVMAQEHFNNTIDSSALRQYVAGVFYKVGLLGIKMESYTRVHFAHTDSRSMSSLEIRDDCICAVHKMFWRALGIQSGA